MEVEALGPADDVDAPVSLDFEDWVEACAGSLMSLAYVVGCQGHGFDDGVHLRTLTHEAIAPVHRRHQLVHRLIGVDGLDLVGDVRSRVMAAVLGVN